MEKDCDLSEEVSYEELTSDISKQFNKYQKAHSTGFVRIQPYNQVMPRSYLKYERAIKNFELRSEDVWVCTFPKCGTTWTQELVWCIMNDLNFEKAKKIDQKIRVPFMEKYALCDDYLRTKYDLNEPNMIEQTKHLASPRIMKTHLSLDMLPNDITNKGKIIYVIRNPRDTCLSFYNHWHLLMGFTGGLNVFIDAFLAGECGYNTPVLEHMIKYWEASKKPNSNILIIMFEDMKRDLAGAIRKVAAFLGKEVPESKMPELLEHLSFEAMKNNPTVNKQRHVEKANQVYNQSNDTTSFMRKGQAGSWRETFSEDLITRFEEWERKGLQGTGLISRVRT